MLFVDLTSKTYEIREITEDLAKNYLGGPALGAKILYDEMPPHTDAFDEKSMIGFVSGPANAAGVVMGGRYTVVSKSPVNNRFNDANSGGDFGPTMRRSGFDAIFVKGIADKPVYLYINNGAVEFKDAAAVWGKPTLETEQIIRNELGQENICVALIGPAGENLSHIAAVMNDGHRAAGRGGSGAVMGSKKLKGIAVYGNQKIEVADREKIRSITKEITDYTKGSGAQQFSAMQQYGTPLSYETLVSINNTAIKNFFGIPEELTDEMKQSLSLPPKDAAYKQRSYGCNACIIKCGAFYDIPNGKWPLKHAGRPEYETFGAFGSMLLNADFESIVMCNHMCNEFGFDTISAGATIAWAMHCYNEGVLSKEELDGIDLRWGNSDAIVELLRKMGAAEGVGKILLAGSVAAAEHFGKGNQYLGVAGGIEMPQHDPRFAPGLARTYKYDPTPARHVKGGYGPAQGFALPEVKYDYENKGQGDVEGVIHQEIINAGGFCMIADGNVFQNHSVPVRLLNAITGFAYDEHSKANLGVRSYTIRHAFNLREGMRRKDFDISPRMIGKPPMEEGANAGVTVDVEKLADSFFQALHWHVETAVPTKEALAAVGGLEQVANDLYPIDRKDAV